MGICPKVKMSDRWLEQCMNFKFMDTDAKTQVKLCRYGQEMKHHSIQWKTSHHWDQERHMSLHQVQTVLFLITRAFVHFEFLERDQNMNQHCYLEILVCLHDAVHLKRPELQPDACIMHHDNFFTHDMLLSGSFWPKNWYWNLTIHRIHQIFPCVNFGYSQIESHFEGSQILRHCHYLGTWDSHSEENFRREVPALFWRVKTLTDWVYYSAGRWLWRWREVLVCKVMKCSFYRGFTESLSHLVCLQFVVLQCRHVLLALRCN